MRKRMLRRLSTPPAFRGLGDTEGIVSRAADASTLPYMPMRSYELKATSASVPFEPARRARMSASPWKQECRCEPEPPAGAAIGARDRRPRAERKAHRTLAEQRDFADIEQ